MQEEFFATFPMLEYGYNKNARIFINISDCKEQTTFGFATKNEIERIKSLSSDVSSCRNNGLASIQYFVERSAMANTVVPSKSILTPFVFSCEHTNSFKLQINISNGKNHLDYRCQNAMIYSIIFSCAFFILGISFFIYSFSKRRSQFASVMTLVIFIICAALHEILIYLYLQNNKYSEYPNVYQHDLAYNLLLMFDFLGLTSLLVYNLILHYYASFLSRRKKIFIEYYFIGIASFIFLLISLIFQFLDTSYTNYIISAVFYLLFFIIEVLIPSPYSFSKFAIILYVLGSFYTFSLNIPLIIESNESMNGNIMLLDLNIASITLQIITIILLLIGFFYFHDADLRRIVLVFNLNQNYTEEEQRYGSLFQQMFI